MDNLDSFTKSINLLLKYFSSVKDSDLQNSLSLVKIYIATRSEEDTLKDFVESVYEDLLTTDKVCMELFLKKVLKVDDVSHIIELIDENKEEKIKNELKKLINYSIHYIRERRELKWCEEKNKVVPTKKYMKKIKLSALEKWI